MPDPIILSLAVVTFDSLGFSSRFSSNKLDPLTKVNNGC